ncbi:MAG: SDR family NAD(P)-dependent oxidoreductase, partial [Pirellulaceae bacterium]|nr:SDR family NAD(P)-dependent oxidoreductase [Pirellulaceae bacterium]
MGYWNEKVVVITGGSSGFGRSLAGCFAGAGARVVIAARDRKKLESAAKSIDGDVTARTVDITDDGAVEKLV